MGNGTDHEDHDGLNNRRENLRPASASEQGYNKGTSADSTTGFKGVHFHKQQKNFHARITVNGKRHELGQFNTVPDAARAYNEAAKKYHGEFAVLNDVGDHDLILNQGYQAVVTLTGTSQNDSHKISRRHK